jgi:hypothetical protein
MVPVLIQVVFKAGLKYNSKSAIDTQANVKHIFII